LLSQGFAADASQRTHAGNSRLESAISSRPWRAPERKPVRPTFRRAVRWPSTRPGFCSITCCPSPRRNTAVSVEAVRRRRATWKSRGGHDPGLWRKIPSARFAALQAERALDAVVMQNSGEHIPVVSRAISGRRTWFSRGRNRRPTAVGLSKAFRFLSLFSFARGYWPVSTSNLVA
jgi:hypothetical protein